MSVRTALGRLPVAQAAYRGAVAGRLHAERWALAARPPSGAKASRGRILAYHSIGTPAWGVNDVRPADFERHLQIAVDEGWTFATIDQVLAEPEHKQLALTFDDGATTTLTRAAPVLRHHGIPATAFVVTGWADGGHPDGFDHVLDWSGLERLQAAGMTLHSHSVTHPDFGQLGADRTERELTGSRERLRTAMGIDSTDFAIPFGQSRNWTDAATDAAHAAGYTRIWAQSVDTRPAGTLPRTFVTRIDRPRIFRAALAGAYDAWEEWYLAAPVAEEIS